MTQYHYRRAGSPLYRDLAESLRGGLSSFLIGPRGIGKRYALEATSKFFSARKVIFVDFLSFPSGITDSDIRTFIAAQVGRNLNFDPKPLLRPPEVSMSDLLHPLFSEEEPLLLFASNPEALPHRLAVRFLQEIQGPLKKRHLIALISGEPYLYDLLPQVSSDTHFASTVILQGLDEREFEMFLCRRRTAFTGIQVEESDPRLLFEYTGGNPYLLDLLVHAALQERSYSGEMEQAYSGQALINSFESITTANPGKLRTLSDITRSFETDPNCWPEVDSLLSKHFVPIQGALPYDIELYGMAIRENNQLRFASQMHAHIFKRYCTPKKWGDLHARVGLWVKAFDFFSQMSEAERARPTDAEDRYEVRTTIDAVAKTFYHLVTTKVSARHRRAVLRARFMEACNALFGLEAFFGKRTDKDGWIFEKISELAKTLIADLRDVLPREPAPTIGIRAEGSVPLGNCLVAVLPGLRSDEPEVIVIADARTSRSLSRERRILVTQLFEPFVTCYLHTTSVLQTEWRLQWQQLYTETIASIYDAIGRSQFQGTAFDLEEAVSRAAAGLRRLNYKRVLICLVDPQRTRIIGVKDDSDDPTIDVAKLTNYPLAPPHEDIQPSVVLSRSAIVLKHALGHSLVNLNVARRARMESLAIVPILNREDTAVGTIHVERDDGGVPDADEIKDLLAFGKAFATALEQCERSNLLQSSLDRLPTPLVIFNARERIRYANKAAEDLFNVQSKWYSTEYAPALEDFVQGSAFDQVKISLALAKKETRVTQIPAGGKRKHAQVVTNCLFKSYNASSPGENSVLGGLLYLVDFDYLLRMVQAFEKVTEAQDVDSALLSLLGAMKELGHRWGRLYKVDNSMPEKLVGWRSYHLDDEVMDKVFPSTPPTELTRQNEEESWSALLNKEPMVFVFDPTLPDNSEKRTEAGIAVRTVKELNSQCGFQKAPGTFWLDFPLLAGDQPIGKMTLECSENFPREDFDFLKVLCVLLRGWLDALGRNARLAKETQELRVKEEVFQMRDEIIKDAAAVALRDTAHNLVSRLGALPVILTKYRLLQKNNPSITELNKEFKDVLQGILDTAKNCKERLAGVVPKTRNTSIAELIQNALRSNLEGNWTVADETNAVLPVDPFYVTGAIVELVHNSRKAVPVLKNLKVDVEVREGKNESGANVVEIVYRDNGPGINPELKSKIFDNFYTSWPARQGRGTSLGLGLGFVKNVFKAHGGEVSEIGEFGHGVVFILRLPKS